eukprot:gene7365-8578_t
MTQKIVKLHCVAQTYGWGNFGLSSTVAQLLSADSCNTIQETTPYAELWMGAHPVAPSRVHDDKLNKDVTLKEYIDANGTEEMLGKAVVERFGLDFPFLFKVLSIRTALSIQSHPDSQLAKQLFKDRPEIYNRDPHHKPEIAIALTPFKALCSFRDLKEIHSYVDSVPELHDIVGQVKAGDECAAYLREVVTVLLQTDAKIVADKLDELVERLKQKSDRSKLDDLALVLHDQYPGDVGVFFIYLLNYIEMEPGQALFLPAGEPHAYIAGDCVECMAPSDNVVRAGLTPKLKDVETLASMLTYTTGQPPFIQPICNSQSHSLFRPPVDEFEVERYQFSASETVGAKGGPSIILVLDGQVEISNHLPTPQPRGTVLFVPSNTGFTITSTSSTPSTIFIARVNQNLFTNK